MSDFTDRLRSLSSRGGTHGNVRYQPLQFENEIEQRRKVFRQKQLKKICWAAFLAIIGFSLLVVGINWYFVDHKGYSAFLMVGVLAFIPGAYGIYETIGTLQGWEGFDQQLDGDQDDDSWTYTL